MSEPQATGHLDLDALADALAGERDDDPHLRTCPSCADRLAELAAAEVAVVASLATLPEPPLPDGLAERLAAALRAERASSARVVPLRRRRPPSWLPAVAASLGVVLAGGVGMTLLRGATTGGEDAATSAAGGGAESGSTSPDSADTTSLVPTASGADYADPAQRSAVLPRVLAGTAPLADRVAPEASRPEDQDAPALPTPALTGTRPLSGALERLRDPQALADCVAALTPADATGSAVLALDHGSYRGSPARAVVQPDRDPDRLLLTVVDPGCSAADPRTLLQVRVDRP